MAGLLLVDLAGERAVLRKLAAGARRAMVTKTENYASDYGQDEGHT